MDQWKIVLLGERDAGTTELAIQVSTIFACLPISKTNVKLRSSPSIVTVSCSLQLGPPLLIAY
jgi:hypothetical protein